MSIDWVTVAAQAINFLVLVWLLKRFLYRPILDGIDARERDIKARVTAAETAKAEAAAAAAKHAAALKEIADQKTTLIEAAQAEAEAGRTKLEAETVKTVAAKRAAWEQKMQSDRARYAADLHATGATALLSLTRKALSDLADVQLEDQIVAHLCNQLSALGDDLTAAANRADEAVAVSHWPLSGQGKKNLTDTLQQVAPKASLRFEINTHQSPGIVVHFGGGRISWTVDTYLEGLEGEIAARLASGRTTNRRAALPGVA